MKALLFILTLVTFSSCATYKKMRAGEPLGSTAPAPTDKPTAPPTAPVVNQEIPPALTPPTTVTPAAPQPVTPTVQPTPQPPMPDKTVSAKRPQSPSNSPFIQPDDVYNIPNKDDLKETAQPKSNSDPSAITVPKN